MKMDTISHSNSVMTSTQFVRSLKLNSESTLQSALNTQISFEGEPDEDEDEEDENEEDEEDTDDEYEFQEDYVYDITARLKEVNAQHFAEPPPTSREQKVRFADNPVERVLCYSPTPLMGVDERLQMKKEYLMKLFAKDEYELRDGNSDESDLFSSSDEDDFIDKTSLSNESTTPVEVQLAVNSDKDESIIANNSVTPEATENRTDTGISDELDNKIMELIERSVRSPDYQAGSNTAAKSLGDQIKNTVQESFLKEPRDEPEVDLKTTEQGGSTNNESDGDSMVKSVPEKVNRQGTPAVTLNDSTLNIVRQTSVDRPLPRNLSIAETTAACLDPPAEKVSPTDSPRKNQLTAPKSQAFPPSPTRFIRKSQTGDKRCSSSSSEKSLDTKKLPLYTGNERSRYGLPSEEKVKLKEERDKTKREKEEKIRLEEEAKKLRKIDAQKTFEAWLKNKEQAKRTQPLLKKRTPSPSRPQSETDSVAAVNQTETFMTWLEGKKIQQKQTRLQHKLQKIEIEEVQNKHSRQDAQQAYKRWLRRKALEEEQRRILERKRIVDEKLDSTSPRSKQTLRKFLESEQFHSLSEET